MIYKLHFCRADYCVDLLCDISLYFTKIKLGSPPKEYHVQVDTGSDILWVNCAPCSKCPVKTDLGVCFCFFFEHLSLFYIISFIEKH